MTSEQEEDIERLAQVILKEARDEAEQIQSDAQAKAAEILARAREKADADRDVILQRARQDADRLRSQAVASAQLKARTLQLEHREKILNRVFDAAKQKLSGAQQRADFDQVASMLLKEAVAQLRVSEVEIHADDSTRKALEKNALDEISKELKTKITLGEGLTEGVGVVVNAGGGRLHYDNTLETRLNRLQDALRSPTYHVLIGERL